MNHLLLGAAIPFAIGVLIYVIRRFRAAFWMLITIPLCMAVCMLWAVAPDLPRFFGFYGLYSRLYLDPQCDICFWHYRIDLIETESPWHAVGFALLFVAIILAAWRELYLAEKEN
jgi:hypothetical protein